MLRFCVTHPATFMMTILALIALALGYRAWRIGLPAAILTLTLLALCLILIAILFLTRRRIRRWIRTGTSRSRAAAQKRIARGMVQEGIERGEAKLERGVEAAKGALSNLAEEVKADWKRLVEKPSSAPMQAPCCPYCGRLLPPGAKFCDQCGKPVVCPRCGHILRPEARFCEYCGASVTSRKPT